MKHLIITRVNLPMRLDPHKYKQTELFKSEQWNDDRFRLLNKFARASLRKQTCQNFKFITLWGKVYKGGELPNEVKEPVVDTGSPDCEPLNYRALWEDLPGKKTLNFSDQIAGIAKRHARPPVLITNLDADDCLHKDYVKILQETAFKYKHLANFYLDTKYRYGLHEASGRKGVKVKGKTVTPFVSTIEHKITCIPLRYNHAYIHTMFKGLKIPGLSGLQTINDSNMFCGQVGTQAAEFDTEDYF